MIYKHQSSILKFCLFVAFPLKTITEKPQKDKMPRNPLKGKSVSFVSLIP